MFVAVCIPAIADIQATSLHDLTWVTEEYPPFNFHDNGTPSGLMVDLISAITQKAGEEIPRESFTFLPWNEAYQKAVTDPNTAIFAIAKSPDREDLFTWVGPVVSYNLSLYSKRSKNITISSADELGSYRIGTITDDITIDNLVRAGVKRENIFTNTDPRTLVQDLEDGTIDLFAYGEVAATYYIKNVTGNSAYYKLSGQIGSVPIYIGFSKGTPDAIVKKFRDAFDELKNTPKDRGMSEVDQIVSSWMLGDGLSHTQYFTEGYYPYTFRENGTPKGISVDILQYIASLYGAHIPDEHFTFGTWEDIYKTTMSQNGTALAILARSPERENLFRWAGPVDQTPIVIFALRDSADQLRNVSPSEMKIATITEDIAATTLVNAGGKDIVYSSEPKVQIRMLENGSVDGWAYALLPGRQLISQFASNQSAIVPVQTLKTYDFYIAFNRNTSPRIVNSLQDTMDLLRSEKDTSGVSMYDQILYRYVEPVFSESNLTSRDVTDLVNQTVADLARDAPGTIDRINGGQPPYKNAAKPDLYVFVYDPEVTMIAHGANARMVGLNYHDKVDVAGVAFRDQLVQGALTNGTGWVDYIYSSPAETGLFWKTTRYQLATGSDGEQYIVCAGMYKKP
ncbi:MAG TPA: transporter substrate-binding domain-containing protein [Methanospirillum sp.]|nr:transporter substrate-binding domain-containing protein [Methanospirillum sp.]